MSELVIRFVLGGAIVCVFSLISSVLHPKSFAGIFGSAPSVAIAGLALAFAKHGTAYVMTEANAMLVGSVSLSLYAVVSLRVVRGRVSPALAAGLLWGQWLAVSLLGWAVVLR